HHLLRARGRAHARVIALGAALLSATIVAEADALTAPPRVGAGLTTFTFENRASAPHSIRFIQLIAPHTATEFGTWLQAGGKPPAWVKTVGGVATMAAGKSEDYTFSIAPGSYVVVDGERFAPMRVDGSVARPAPPEADVTIKLRDHGYQLN